MGYITVEYKINDTVKTPIETILGEFEYGSTFALYKDYEVAIPGINSPLDYIKYAVIDESTIIVDISDSYWSIDFFFEKFMSICFYNMLDFGDIYINRIDLSNSEFNKYASRSRNSYLATTGRKTALCGTMFKPYYHSSLLQKIDFAKRCIDLGLNIFKDDECFFAAKKDLINEAEKMTESFSGEADFVPNITAYISDYAFIQSLIDSGINIMMVDYLITGIRPIFNLKQRFPNIMIWGHRIGYYPLRKFISMTAVNTIAIAGGIDYLHVGTPLQSQMSTRKKEVEDLKEKFPFFMPIFTKTTPETLSMLTLNFGYDAIYMGCGYFRDSDSNIDWDSIKRWRLSL